jgi:hypothetical protein
MIERKIISMRLSLDPSRLIPPAHFAREFTVDDVCPTSLKHARKHLLDLTRLARKR